MNSKKNLRAIILLTFVLFISKCNGQSLNKIDSSEEESLIVGTWVSENSTISDKWIFTSNNLLKEYSDGVLDITYTWSISGVSNSGVNSHYLEIINTSNPKEKYMYEISIVSNDELILIYQREDNMGLGKPATYFRQ